MRINRRIRARESPRFETGSTQYQLLMWGTLLLPGFGPGFENDDEARRAWREHRTELLAGCRAGERPYGFYRWDLGIVDRVVHRWFDQLAVLLEHNLIDAEQVFAIEAEHTTLSPSAPAFIEDFFADSREGLLRVVDGPVGTPVSPSATERSHTLQCFRREFNLCAEWHAGAVGPRSPRFTSGAPRWSKALMRRHYQTHIVNTG
jgi:hypothetical protein